MQFSTKTILALSLMSTSDVNGHGTLTKPFGPQNDVAWKDFWYTQGELNQKISN